MNRKPIALLMAGTSSAAIAALHVVIVFLGAPAYRYFGAPRELVRLAEARSLVPAAITFGLALLFCLFAAYAFAAAGAIPRLPLMRTALAGISIIYLLRGVSAVPQGIALALRPDLVRPRDFVFSAVAMIVGVAYALGTRAVWSGLRYNRRQPAAQ